MKREMIARALGRFVGTFGEFFPLDLNALAKQAIVIECGVEHARRIRRPGEVALKTKLFASCGEPPYWMLEAWGSGHHGAPGKAIAIIVSLEE